MISEMQEKVTASHSSLNTMFKELSRKSLDIEKEYESFNSRLT